MANASKMDQRITLRTKAETYAADGSKTQTLTTLAEVAARVENVTAAEGEQISQQTAVETVMFEIRHSPTVATITASDVIEWREKHFSINSVEFLPPGRPDVIRLTAQSRADRTLAA